MWVHRWVGSCPQMALIGAISTLSLACGNQDAQGGADAGQDAGRIQQTQDAGKTSRPKPDVAALDGSDASGEDAAQKETSETTPRDAGSDGDLKPTDGGTDADGGPGADAASEPAETDAGSGSSTLPDISLGGILLIVSESTSMTFPEGVYPQLNYVVSSPNTGRSVTYQPAPLEAASGSSTLTAAVGDTPNDVTGEESCAVRHLELRYPGATGLYQPANADRQLECTLQWEKRADGLFVGSFSGKFYRVDLKTSLRDEDEWVDVEADFVFDPKKR